MADRRLGRADCEPRALVSATKRDRHPDDPGADDERGCPAEKILLRSQVERVRLADEDNGAHGPPERDDEEAGPQAAVGDADRDRADQQCVERRVVDAEEERLAHERGQGHDDGEAVPRRTRALERRVVVADLDRRLRAHARPAGVGRLACIIDPTD
jgi:hypothetical protein